MLVKVKNDDERRLAPTEQLVVRWLRSWKGPDAVAGVAVFDCFVPSRNRPEISNQADVLIWTPHTCVAVEVKGLTEPVQGELSYSANGLWTVNGQPAPMHVARRDGNPLDQVRESMFDLKHLLDAKLGTQQFVAGMVLVVPPPGSELTLGQQPLPSGMRVLLGDGPTALRDYLVHAAKRPPQWDAQRVHEAFAALDLNINMPSMEALVVDGFPVRVAAPGPPPAASWPTTATAGTAAQPAQPAQPASGAGGAVPPGLRKPAGPPRLPEPAAVAAAFRQRMYIAAGLSIVLAVIGGAILIILLSGAGGSKGGDSPGGTPPVPTRPFTMDPGPEPTRPPLTTAKTPCLPFQPGCP